MATKKTFGTDKAITVHNVDGLRRKLTLLPDNLRAEMEKQVELALKALRNEARRNLKSVVEMRTRKLWKSIGYKLDSDKLGGVAGSFDEGYYGGFLEIGRRNMRARPWLRPAYKRQKPLFRKRMVRTLRKIKKMGGKI